ncbi:ATP-dependent nuclease [Fodinibius sediminis]|uniref:Putative ATP-dependent endonuclease of the OLD family n=1 Tax=Fodinibius sediminis TaxID=1214077 RepID=A0A521DZ81_9BACT|nr:AAA family ATPase [Fodinibius sediminis]SMO77017.1 putative ATP-dependent endonuclease of the OLD family [Fodinibius sediminis]
MYLSRLRLWNFRKYSIQEGNTIENNNPGLTVDFKDGLNVLIGENDSGKSTIIDAIKHVLLTQSHEYLRFDEKDFHSNGEGRAENLKIECTFEGFEDKEAASFLEWIGFDDDGNYKLKVWLTAKRKDNRIITDVRAGLDEEGAQLDGNARNLLRVTYLKPLRDAEAELTPGYKSRFAQILRGDDLFIKAKNADGELEEHVLETYVNKANEWITNYFEESEIDDHDGLDIPEDTQGARHIKDTITNFLKIFYEDGKDANPFVEIAGSDLLDILKKLSLNLEENKSGLGSLNLLFIAAELVLLQNEEERGLKLALIEELEAHLHPQAQLRLINYLQQEQNGRQFIVTTHSTTLGSKIDLKNLIICQSDDVYPMDSQYTELNENDYGFLQRFLDATKANLFFAKGVIIVEGDAENLLIPTIAEVIDRPLHKHGVSIVNVGSKALLRYAKIFKRLDDKKMNIQVSVITDLDIEHKIGDESNEVIPKEVANFDEEKGSRVDTLKDTFNSEDVVQVFPSPKWTMEFDLAEGQLAPYINRAIHIAQLVKSREGYDAPFNPLSKEDIRRKCEDANTYLEQIREEQDDDLYVAYKIYEKLKKHHASKAVTAQYLSDIFVNDPENEETDEDYKTEIKEIIRDDETFSYLRDAICHVTKPMGAENGNN